MTENARVRWTENGQAQEALWRSEAGLPPPSRVIVADDTLKADRAFRLANEGTSLLWRGDFQNAKQLLNALARRIDERASASAMRRPANTASELPVPADAFNRHRLAQSQRARTLGRLLVPLGADLSIALPRAPDLRAAFTVAWGRDDHPAASLISLREVLGIIGAYEWRKRGVVVEVLGARIHPHYGVFAPVRSEYLALVNEAPWPEGQVPARAFDIGTGTGVLAAILARRGVPRVVATDLDPRALACAQENIERLGLASRVTLEKTDLFPEGCAPLIVCNPPWIPARPAAPIEMAIFDHDSAMLRGFLAGLVAHLEPGGEGWLVLSDLAVHLGLRAPDWLASEFARCGLAVAGRRDARPQHPKAADRTDPLHKARAKEVTSLWRLRAA